MAGEIFISYRRADEAWARLLHDRLRAEGVEAWYDAHVGPGQDWRGATAKALEASQIFVLLFSSNAAQSSDIAKELAAATLEKKLIIPVRLENIAPKGAFLYELASRNWVNAFEDTEAKLAELAVGLAYLVRTGARDESVLPFDRADGNAQGRSSKRSYKHVLGAAAAAAAIAACGVTAWLLWPAPRWTVESSRPFLSSLALEDFPAFSPDGKMLAYSSGTDPASLQIYVRSLAGGDGIRISHDANADVWPTWSSDGARLAYVTLKAGEPCRIMVATVPAGETREAGHCNVSGTSSIAWRPGTSLVYFSERTGLKGDVIYSLDVDSGARNLVVQKPELRDFVLNLCFSPDGKWLAYLIHGDSIVIRDIATGQERIVGKITNRGSWNSSLTWSEDSRTVLAGISKGIGSEILAFPVDGSSSYSVYALALNVGHIAAGAGSLAVETDTGRINLARAGAKPVSQPDIIDPANGRTWSPTFAPDGTLAFLSNRSGTNAIWTMKPGAAPALLFDGGAASLTFLRFSPDGSRLALTVETPQTVTTKILTTSGASQQAFDSKAKGLGMPSWTLDGKAVILFESQDKRSYSIAIDNPARRRPVGPPHWVGIAMRSDGTFATRVDKPGVWRIDGGIRQINDKYPASYEWPMAFRGDDVLVPEYTSDGPARLWAQPRAGGAASLVAYAPGAPSQAAFAVNPKTGDIIYTASVARDTNIDILTLVRR